MSTLSTNSVSSAINYKIDTFSFLECFAKLVMQKRLKKRQISVCIRDLEMRLSVTTSSLKLLPSNRKLMKRNIS